MKVKNGLFILLVLILGGIAYGQMDTYYYKMELDGIKDQWHKLVIPDAVFGKISNNLSDIRIYGITPANDTIEAPYFIHVTDEKNTLNTIDFNLLNSTKNVKGYFFTYEIPTSKTINRIKLLFKNENFDWRITLEGSHDQKVWYTVLEEYRILSINNSETNYQFSDLNFPNALYRYYRLHIKSDEVPEISSAIIFLDEKEPANYQNYDIGKITIDTTKNSKQSLVDIELKKRLPLSYLQIEVSDNIDYYRPISIAYITDSVETEKGWKFSYTNLSDGILNSLDGNGFELNSTLVKHLRLTIDNQDNQPLHIASINAKGFVHELIARFTQPATYYLVYGREQTQLPKYDFSEGTMKVPVNISLLTLGEVQSIPKKEIAMVEPIFQNKFWLWAVMGVIILVLGSFTLKMLRKTS